MSEGIERQLVGCVDPGGMDNLLFAPRSVVDETRAIREALGQCTTWEEARSALTAEQFGRLSEEFWVKADGEPGGDKPLGDVPAWPALFLYQMADWLPEQIIQGFTIDYDPSLGSGTLISAAQGDEVEESLRELGFEVTWDGNLEELFDVNRV